MAKRGKDHVIATLVPNHEERQLGEKMQELRRQQISLRDIVKELNRLGMTIRGKAVTKSAVEAGLKMETEGEVAA